MTDRKKLFSVEDEAALHPERIRNLPGTEESPEAPEKDKIDFSRACYYSSVSFEPGLGGGVSPEYRELVRREQARYPGAALPLITVLCGLAGGLFAVPAVFLSGIGSWFKFIVITILGPFTEETLKQSGVVFQLEKMRGSLRYNWQFFLAGMLGGAVFSVLENLIYKYIYLANLPPKELADVMAFRWTICTMLHVLCTVVSSLGLRRVWKESLAEERPCRISDALPWFAAATIIHGLYNLSMLLLDPFSH